MGTVSVHPREDGDHAQDNGSNSKDGGGGRGTMMVVLIENGDSLAVR